MRDDKLIEAPVNSFLGINDMVWPAAGERASQIEWVLRYGSPTRQELLVAASIIGAYRELATCTEAKRKEVVRALRADRQREIAAAPQPEEAP